tara:strand:+ start:351 stop:524 length:174 start_codon:yes stop_codon:yes gene_type:complete
MSNLEVIMSSKKTHSQDFKNKILEEVKKLTNEGKHIEASALFNAYFEIPKDEENDDI